MAEELLRLLEGYGNILLCLIRDGPKDELEGVVNDRELHVLKEKFRTKLLPEALTQF